MAYSHPPMMGSPPYGGPPGTYRSLPPGMVPTGGPPGRSGPQPAARPRRAPVGVRGAPSGPRANLERVDVSATKHQLYVKVVTSGDTDEKSRTLTLQVLKYIHARLPMFAKMGVAIKVNKITSQALQNPRLITAMRGRGIKRLPALTTPNNVYIGPAEIQKLYETNIKTFAAEGRREERPIEGAAPDNDDLESFYRDEMTFERAEEDAQETGIGESDDMMDAYRRMCERREQSDSKRRPRVAPGTGRSVTSSDDRRAAPPRPAVSTRPDNVGPPPARAPAARARASADPLDDEIEATIERLAQDIDDNTISRAFTASGGDSLEDDGGSDIQDDLMERAYWGNQAES